MSRIIYILILLSFYLHSQNVIINDYNDSDYPVIQLETYFLDDNQNQFIPPKDEILIFENQSSVNFEINCGNLNNYERRDFILLIDVSQSMQGFPSEFAVKTSKYIINRILDLNPENEILISAFSNINNIISDFSSQRDILINSLDNIINFGYTDFNNALYLSANSAIELASKKSENISVIIITDSKATANSDKIIEKANINETKINVISISEDVAPELKKVSLETGGNSYGNIDLESELNYITEKIFISSFDLEPCIITYLSDNCDFRKNIKVNYNNLSDSININVNPEKFVFIDYPDFNSIQFFDEQKKEIRIVAKNANILIEDIIFDESKFKINDNYKNLLLNKNLSVSLEIENLTDNQSYVFEEFEIISEACFGKSFYVTAGTKDSLELSEIQVISPNGDEIFQANTDTMIKWSGVSPSDTVNVEFSSNGGNSWIQLKNQTFAGLSGKFITPDINSDECLIRVKQLTENIPDENISIIKAHTNEPVDLKWTNDGNYIYSGAIDGKIIRWNATNRTLDKTILNNLFSLNDFDHDPSGFLIAYAQNLPEIIIYNSNSEMFLDTLKSPEGSIKKIEWQDNGSLIAGLSNSNIIIWDFPAKLPINTISANENIFTDIAFSNDGNYLAVSTFEGKIIVYDTQDYSIVNSVNTQSQSINSIDWSSNNKNIIFGSNDNNFAIWNVLTNTKLTEYLDNNSPVNNTEWGESSGLIASSNNKDKILLWSPGASKHLYEYNFHKNRINSITWNPLGKSIASIDITGELHIWSVDDMPFEKATLQQDISDDNFRIIKPEISSSNIIFNPKFIGSTTDSIFNDILINTGKIDIRLDSIKIIGDNSFSLLSSYPNKLKIDSNLSFKIRFKPTSQGAKNADLVLYSGLNIFKSNIIGFAIDKRINLFKDEINFGNVNLFARKDTSVILLKNISSEVINIEDFELLNKNEQFEILSDITSINPNESFEIELSYNPQNLVRTGEILKIHFDKSPEVYIALSGRGVAPKLVFDEIHKFDTLRCNENKSTDNLIIKNYGTNILRIDSIKIKGDNQESFKINLLNNFININDSNSIEIFFEPQYVGFNQAELIIYSNTKNDFTDSTSIFLNGFYDIINISFNKDKILFSDLDKNLEYLDTLKIYNNGTSDINIPDFIDLNYFQISSKSKIILPDDSSEMIIKFKGAAEEGQYSDIFEFTDYCGNEYQISLDAIIGNSSAIINTIQKLQFKNTICGNQIIDTVLISNSGLTNLIIYDVKIAGENQSSFEIVNKSQNITIEPNQQYSLLIKTQNLINGLNLANVELYSNAENADQGISNINIEIFNDYTELDFSRDTVYFRNALEDISYTQSFEIYNSGNITYSINDIFESDYFEIIDYTDYSIEKDQSIAATIKFIGGKAGESYESSYSYIDTCDNLYKIYFIADVVGYAQAGIKTDTFYVNIGDTLRMPIKLYSPENIDLPDVNSYDFDISLNANILKPINNEYQGTIENNIRTISVENAPSFPDSDGNITYIDFLVTLGDTNFTEIIFENAGATNNENILVATKNSAVFIAGYCESGGSRFIDYTGIIDLKQNSPNPADENTEIVFSLIEEGYYKLELFDIRGYKIKTISEGEAKVNQEISVNLNLSDLSAGNYLYVLTTQNHKIVKKLTVKR